MHVCSIGAVLEPGADDVLALLDRFRDTATITYDVNARPAVTGTGPEVVGRVEAVARRSDVVKASDEDLAWLYPDRSVADVMAEWHAAGVCCAVVTRGGEGAWLLAPDGTLHEQPAVRTTVVDTVGAGDSFTGGLLAASSGSSPI